MALELGVLRSVGAMDATPPAPAVSIVIPTFNHLEDFLKPCLASVREHTDLDRCEVIVVSNGSTDGTEEFLRTLPGKSFRALVHADPLGFPAAANAGIREARGEFVVLLNNDTVLLPQPRNLWIDLLAAPFRGNHRVGISGPVKFNFPCGATRRRAIAFWCAMIRRAVFAQCGLLDEIFSPGMGEDADLSIKAEKAGWALVRVPKDGETEFGKGMPEQVFPIYHRGSGTFGERDHSDVRARNDRILGERHGGPGDRIEEIYGICRNHPSDINELFPTLRGYAGECGHITEFGVRGVFSTWAFLAGRPSRMVGYDIEASGNVEEARRESEKAGISYEFIQKNVLEADIEPTDLLFIDTRHTYAQLKAELSRHAKNVRKYILVHDTESFGKVGEDGGPGELRAVEEFLAEHREWALREQLPISNGLVVLERGGAPGKALAEGRRVDVSIVIPTVDHFHDALKVCLGAVLAYTDLSDKEIIVVFNGSPKEAVEHVRALSSGDGLPWNKKGAPGPVRFLEFPERVGYIRAVNAGIAVAKGTHVVTLDDDSFLLPQPVGLWIETLLRPFRDDPKVAATGPFSSTYDDLGQVLHSGCTMYERAALLSVGLFDEAFNPGYLGDEDLSIRLRKAGRRIVEVPEGQKREYVDGVFRIQFPVVHTGTVKTMPKDSTDRPLVERNRKLILERHGPKSASRGRPKVSVIIPTYKNNFRKDEKTGLEVNLLRRNLESLARWTDLAERNVEVVVVCNGCRDGQEEYVKSLGAPFRAVSFPDPLGYTRATNEGIKASTGDYLVFLNDDCEILPLQPKNLWLEWLLEPFLKDPKTGVTGPLQLFDDYAQEDVIIGFCLCVKRDVLSEVMKETGGLLDETYSPGSGEDIDLCCRVRRAGYRVLQVPDEGVHGYSHVNCGRFPIYHVSNQTFVQDDSYTRWTVKRNGWLNVKRHSKNIRLNLGSGGCHVRGYLSVDLHDRRADIIADMEHLGLPDGSVTEFLSIHSLEHVSPFVVDDMLRDWLRMLKPGGKLTLELPNVEELCRKFLETTDFGRRWEALNGLYAPVNTTGEGAATGEKDTEITSPHLYGYWPEELRQRLERIGYVDVTFGPERWPHPHPPNMHVEAVKPGVIEGISKEDMPMLGLWNNDTPQPVRYGDETSYAKAMEFLGDCPTVEDWGCGSGYARRFVSPGQTYVGIDGSKGPHCDKVADLRGYRSSADGILIRHVLEHCWGWKRILENALASMRRKLALVVFTPFGEETRQIAVNWSDIPDLSFKKGEITGHFKAHEWREITFASRTQYGRETIFFVERR